MGGSMWKVGALRTFWVEPVSNQPPPPRCNQSQGPHCSFVRDLPDRREPQRAIFGWRRGLGSVLRADFWRGGRGGISRGNGTFPTVQGNHLRRRKAGCYRIRMKQNYVFGQGSATN